MALLCAQTQIQGFQKSIGKMHGWNNNLEEPTFLSYWCMSMLWYGLGESEESVHIPGWSGSLAPPSAPSSTKPSPGWQDLASQHSVLIHLWCPLWLLITRINQFLWPRGPVSMPNQIHKKWIENSRNHIQAQQKQQLFKQNYIQDIWNFFLVLPRPTAPDITAKNLLRSP